MNIFFSASSDVDCKTKNQYIEVIDFIESLGHKVSQCLFTDISKKELHHEKDYNDVYNEVLKSIDDADVYISDISHPSGGVGYQIYHALYQRKPVIVLYSSDIKDNPSVILRGINSKRVQILKYSGVNDLRTNLPGAIKKAIGMVKVRFNLVMNNRDYAFIESESKIKGITKTKYINKLIHEAKQK